MNELTTKRLAIIKQLYLQGINQSYDSEPMNGFCLLSFHDSVEMFMKLCAEQKDIKINRDVNFGDYFIKIPDLQGNAAMNNLNNKRVNLKHYGSLPSVIDVETSRTNVTDFFEQNTPTFFGVKFSEISLISLIKYESVREYMSKSLADLESENYKNSILNSQIAFKELLYCHKEDKIQNYTSPFKISEDFNFCSSSSMRLGISQKLNDFIDKTEKSFSKIDEIIGIIGFRIDYKKYCKFKILSPYIQPWFEDGSRKYEFYDNKHIICDKRNAQFCFDFVIESALQLQRFDFDINDLRKEDE